MDPTTVTFIWTGVVVFLLDMFVVGSLLRELSATEDKSEIGPLALMVLLLTANAVFTAAVVVWAPST